MQKKKLFSLLCSFVFTGTMLAGSFYPAVGKIDPVKAEETAVDSEADYTSGDINGDGIINVFDFNRLNRYLDGSIEFDAEQMKAADFNYDRSVDGNDLASMSEFITMYSDMPVDYNRRRFIVNAKNFCLKYGETTQIELSIKIPDSWQKNDLSFYGDGEKIADIPFTDLTEGEKSTIGGYDYTEYSVSVPVADYGDEDTRGLSVDLTVQMNNHESYPIMLNRAVKDAKERIEKSCELIGAVSEYAQQLPEGSSKEEILSEVKKWIEANADLEITGSSYDRIDFKTVYGLNSYFEVEEAEEEISEAIKSEEETETANEAEKSLFVEDEENTENTVSLDNAIYSNNLTSGSAVSYDDELNKYLTTPKLVNSNTLALMDPDVLLHVPCYTDYAISISLPDFRDIGNKLVDDINNYVGSDLSSYYSGQFDEIDGFDMSVFGKWDQYGTVFFNTHGAKETVNGTDRTLYLMYECEDDYFKAKEKAIEIHDSLNDITGFNPEGSTMVSYLTDDMSLGVEYYVGYVFKVIPVYQVVIGSGTIMQLLSQAEFPNTVFYFTVCDGGADDIFNQFLLDHGAAGVIGYEYSVASDVAPVIARDAFSLPLETNSDGSYYSLQEAVVKADTNYISNPFNMWSAVVTTTYYKLEYSVTATLQCEKYFYYAGKGTLKGRAVVENGDAINVIAYRYYNGAMYPVAVATTKTGGWYEFSDLDWGYYLIQISDAVNGKATEYIRTDFTEKELDLGQINVFDEKMNNIFLYVKDYYRAFYGREEENIYYVISHAYNLKKHRFDYDAAHMVMSFYYSDEFRGSKNSSDMSWGIDVVKAMIGYTTDDEKNAVDQILNNEYIKLCNGEMESDEFVKFVADHEAFARKCESLGIRPGTGIFRLRSEW